MIKITINYDNLLFGLDTFGDLAYHDETNEQMTYEESLQMIIKEVVLADKLGVDVIALGEHHRKEYSITSPEMVLAALSQVTKNITLGTGVTVLSSDDPVRVYERFATLDALSNGRAQVMLGRGSFTESFPLFGYELKDYNELFEEKIEMFNELLKGEPITWKGTFTQSLNHVELYPKLSKPLDVAVGVGGSPDSIIRAAKYGFPVMLAIIGGRPSRFKPFIELYHRSLEQFGHQRLPVGMHAHGVIAKTDEDAREIAWKYVKKSMEIIGKERGWSPMTKEQFNYEVEHGAYFVGAVETVAQKIARTVREMGVERFDLVYGIGGHLQSERFQTIQLYGAEVIPRVRELLKNT